MSLANRANQARALEQLKNNQQTEYGRRRVKTNQLAAWRTEYGTELPGPTITNPSARFQGIVDTQHTNWASEIGDPAPSFYGDQGYSDARDLIAALGGDSVVPGFYDCRYGLYAPNNLAEAWSDIRGSAAPAGVLLASGSQRPTCGSDGNLSFDGVAQFLRTDLGLGIIGGSCWIVLIMRGTNTVARREVELSVGASASIMTAAITTAVQFHAQAIALSAISAALTASPRIFHVRRTITVDVASRVGNGAETAAASATGAQTASRLTVGSDRTNPGGSFSAMQGLRAVIVGNGVYSAGQVALINAWAQAAHGAVLTN